MSFPTFREWIESPEAITAMRERDDFIAVMLNQANKFNGSSMKWERKNAAIGSFWNCACYELWEMLREEYEAEHEDDDSMDSAECASGIIDRENAEEMRGKR